MNNINLEEKKENDFEFGNNFAKSRLNAEVTQLELAVEIDYSVPSIQRWESGKCLNTLKKLAHLEEVLGTSLYELFSGEKL